MCYLFITQGTQPRRLAATALAERVADERAEALGDKVGYAIRLETKRSSRTRLLFCTTGILLRQLEGDKTLKGVSHIIVDEVSLSLSLPLSVSPSHICMYVLYLPAV